MRGRKWDQLQSVSVGTVASLAMIIVSVEKPENLKTRETLAEIIVESPTIKVFRRTGKSLCRT